MADYGEGMKAFVRCPSCKHLVFTNHVLHLMTLILGKEKYICKQCGTVLDFIPVYLCSRELGDKCKECDFRFSCYSMRTATKEA
jgi:primosomal protein N'